MTNRAFLKRKPSLSADYLERASRAGPDCEQTPQNTVTKLKQTLLLFCFVCTPDSKWFRIYHPLTKSKKRYFICEEMDDTV